MKPDEYENVSDFIQEVVDNYCAKHDIEDVTCFDELLEPIRIGMQYLVNKQRSLEGYFWNISGQSPMDVLLEMEEIQNNYLLDERNSEDETVPLTHQIRERLEILEEYEENEEVC